MLPSQFFVLLVATASLTLAQIITRDEFHRRHVEASQRRMKRLGPRAHGTGIPKPKNITFHNPKASGRLQESQLRLILRRQQNFGLMEVPSQPYDLTSATAGQGICQYLLLLTKHERSVLNV